MNLSLYISKCKKVKISGINISIRRNKVYLSETAQHHPLTLLTTLTKDIEVLETGIAVQSLNKHLQTIQTLTELPALHKTVQRRRNVNLLCILQPDE